MSRDPVFGPNHSMEREIHASIEKARAEVEHLRMERPDECGFYLDPESEPICSGERCPSWHREYYGDCGRSRTRCSMMDDAVVKQSQPCIPGLRFQRDHRANTCAPSTEGLLDKEVEDHG